MHNEMAAICWYEQGSLTDETVESKLGTCMSYGNNELRWLLTCTANAFLPTPPSPRSAIVQLSIPREIEVRK